MHKIAIILLLLMAFLLAGCGKEEHAPNGNNEQIPEMIEVDLSVPEQTSPGEEITIEAKVTQGGEEVEDADSVKFEIWNKEDKETSVIKPYENKSGGTYAVKHTFPSDGVYVVQVHVDARNLHVMPLSEVQVGEGAAADHSHSETEHHENTTGHDHHADTDIAIHFMNTAFSVNSETELLVHLSKEEEPYTEAEVRFEVWLDGTEQHAWIDASETNPGEYAATHQFDTAGTYNVVIHVEHEDGTHIHSEETITVE
ncbi:MAG TPA: FixH family protein [Bacillus sp. (in: firmicutes)]|nr:FixH family protein [Bacillus sp. (in: firmicutes)]